MSQPHDGNPFAPPSQGTPGHQPVTGQSPWAQPEQPWQWGPPAYSMHPAYPTHAPPQQDRDRNSFALIAMVLGILGFILPNQLLSPIFGIIGLNQIRKRGERGKGMAITGIVLGVVWIIAYVATVIVAIFDDVERDPTGEITAAGTVAIGNLAVGDCVESVDDEGSHMSVDVVPCDEPHDNEVFARFYPTALSWADGDREIICLTDYLDGPRVGSIEGK